MSNKIIIICDSCGECLDIASKHEELEGALVIKVLPHDCWNEDDEDDSWECEEDDYN